MTNDITPRLLIIHANRLEKLRELAVDWVGNYPLAPLETEVFLVQSNGMAQWLKLALAAQEGRGICAATQFLMPSRFLWNAYRSVLGGDAVPEHSVFDKSRLLWRIYRWLTRPQTDVVFEPLTRYLGANDDDARRFALAQKLADLFDQYQVYRADWLNAWQEGLDVLPASGSMVSANAVEVPPGQRWQPALWRALVAEVPDELQGSGRSHVHQRFVELMHTQARRPAGLPRRLHVFGLSSMSTQMLEALQALSAHVDVLVYVLNPCRHFWADIMEGRELLAIERHRHARKPGLPPGLPAQLMAMQTNPLLAAWGKQGRDFIGLLYKHDAQPVAPVEVDLFESPLEASETLLTRIQEGIFDLEPLPMQGEARQPIAEDDRSVQFHVCHSRQREVEVLQDRLLDLFANTRDLQPRDIVVMAPDIQSYAPHVEAVFGNVSPQDARYLPFTLADRPERTSHPLARALETLLHWPELRIDVSTVLDLLDVEAVRERFDIRAVQLPVLQRWMVQSGVRWGLSASQRASLDLPEDLPEQNTWVFGLRRILLGYACGRGDAWCGVQPLGSVGGLEGALAGQLAVFLDAAEALWQKVREPLSVTAWVEVLLWLTDTFFLCEDERDVMLLRRFRDAVQGWRDDCEAGGVNEETLPLAVVREAVMTGLDSDGVSQRFLAGCVNFCTLMPMRSIPFKVVCLLGMGDGEYPRSRAPADFDLMAGRYRPGDRSRREDDRYLFLEAVLSARDVLYISHVGRNVRDDAPRPESVLVAQLRDYIENRFCNAAADNGKGLLERLTLAHPLQPFSKRYFAGHPQLFTYSREWRDIHAGAEKAPPQVLPPLVRDVPLTLAELERFLRQPVEAFYSQRLKVYFPREDELDVDCETFGLNGLDLFVRGRDLIESRMSGRATGWDETVQRWKREGILPAAAWGDWAVRDLPSAAGRVWAGLDAFAARYPDSCDPVAVEISDARGVVWLRDDVTGICGGGDRRAILDWRPGDAAGKSTKGLKPHYFLGLWVRQVCLAASGEKVDAIMVAADGQHYLEPPEREQAQALLQSWQDAWAQGMRAPLPVAFKAALEALRIAALENARNAGAEQDDKEKMLEKVRAGIRKTYEGDGFNSDGERGESMALTRTWERLDDREDFLDWAQSLYGDMQAWLEGAANWQEVGA